MRPRHPRTQVTRGSRARADELQTERERIALLERMAESFAEPTTAGIDWDALREGKRRAWRAEYPPGSPI